MNRILVSEDRLTEILNAQIYEKLGRTVRNVNFDKVKKCSPGSDGCNWTIPTLVLGDAEFRFDGQQDWSGVHEIALAHVIATSCQQRYNIE
ncbi:MAG: hypothetical protein JKY40_10675 [Gammaproteobacteria bacterium]|nr:hypothetical protein [Gammaproteobacteria bacterium]MBL4729750.1 hypothetical protein [Gammaproteobacteria bacterium]